MKTFAPLLVMAFLVACASTGPRIESLTNPTTDFSGMNTFNFMQPLGVDRPGGAQTPLGGMLRSALSREMEQRGFYLSDNPDILLNVFVVTEERMDVRQVPTATSFRSYRRGRYSTWGNYRTEVRQYTRGTLAVDLVDARNNMLAWEAIAQQRLGRNADPMTLEQVDKVIEQVMAEFPHVAAR